MTDDVTQPAVIGRDGIGPEVTEQALHVLEQTVGSDAFATHEYHLGAAHWKATGEVLDNSTLAEIAQEVAIVLDAVGATPDSTEVPSVLFGTRPFRPDPQAQRARQCRNLVASDRRRSCSRVPECHH